MSEESPWPWLRNPRHRAPLLALALLLALIYVRVYAEGNPGVDVSFWQNIALAAFTGFLGASVALWIQSFLSREGQDYRFRQEVEAKHFEEIYGPLYEATRDVGRSLRAHEYAGFSLWTQIREGKYGLFVPRELAGYLDALGHKCDRSWEIRKEAQASARKAITALATDRGWVANLAAVPSMIESAVDNKYLYDPEANIPSDSTVYQTWQNIQSSTEVSQSNVLQFLLDLKKLLIVDAAVGLYDRECRNAGEYAESLHEVIGKRMISPFKFG